MQNQSIAILDDSAEIAVQMFTADNGLKPVIAQVADIVASFEHDMSTATSRKRTASLSSKVSKFKVRIESIGKQMADAEREKIADVERVIKMINANRREVKDELDALRDLARKPLTDWETEQAEAEARTEAEKIRAEIDALHELALLMNEKHVRDREEQYRLAEIERQKRDDDIRANAAKELAERAFLAEQQLEVERDNARKREEQLKQEAFDRELKAEQAAEQAAIDARIVEIEAVQKQDVSHISRIRSEAKESIMRLGFSEQEAKKLVMCINNGLVSNVVINY
jgi:colicin import membrane protein